MYVCVHVLPPVKMTFNLAAQCYYSIMCIAAGHVLGQYNMCAYIFVMSGQVCMHTQVLGLPVRTAMLE
jgi:hypothetical protein